MLLRIIRRGTAPAGVALLASCGPTQTAAPPIVNYSALATETLWHDLSVTGNAREMMLIEAELAARGQRSSGSEYIGRRTSSTVGRTLYSRSTPVSGDRNCSDFASGAEAQRFFLAAGGPVNDPHGLDRDGDGNACEWGRTISANATRYKPRPVRVSAPRQSSSRCYVGPRGGTYTITASGNRNYDGC
ncbi:excalibur calcium-binding domain-containing protein [Paracoccus haematequi]|uniref:excalibur calcium-binding domain-containing protein n=1 Tax=Paracoccus haematequi TaxID=2491866 RepID=UPI000F7F9DE6|nr:excalibur calcium-binding domain-containing protein [Paracoccus haematequi]